MSESSRAIKTLKEIPVEQIVTQPILNEKDWRDIHNGLAAYQNQILYGKRRDELQVLMDKVRDNFIK